MSMSRGLGRGLQLCKAVWPEEVGIAASSSALQHLRCERYRARIAGVITSKVKQFGCQQVCWHSS